MNFVSIKVKNFKSLNNITFDLKKSGNKTNNLIAIYGENGSGKTNIVEVFFFLQRLIFSRNIDIEFSKLPKDMSFLNDALMDRIPDSYADMFKYKNDFDLIQYRTIGNNEDSEIEYIFEIDNITGSYYIRFNDEIVEEKLKYLVKKQKAYYFNIKMNENRIEKELNFKIFTNKEYNKELLENIDKYWGKYSFLSLLVYEMTEKNEKYIFDNVSRKLYDIIFDFLKMNIKVEKGLFPIGSSDIFKKRGIFDLKEGIIEERRIKELKVAEKVLRIFFTQAYSDIKDVNYKYDKIQDAIKYKLYFTKIVNEKLVDIPVNIESAGTKRIVDEINAFVGALIGETVVIDEIDNGIHDLLIKNIILSIKDDIKGQLIFTTHNTLLLEVLPRESIYILATDYLGRKNINSIKKYGIRIQKNHNIRDMFLYGLFGWVTIFEYIDFYEISEELKQIKEGDAD